MANLELSSLNQWKALITGVIFSLLLLLITAMTCIKSVLLLHLMLNHHCKSHPQQADAPSSIGMLGFNSYSLSRAVTSPSISTYNQSALNQQLLTQQQMFGSNNLNSQIQCTFCVSFLFFVCGTFNWVNKASGLLL